MTTDERKYVDIRIIPKDQRLKNKTVDVFLYSPIGERLKVKKESWQDGFIRSGPDLTERNNYIQDLKRKIEIFIEVNPVFTKQLIEIHLYGKENIERWKGKRLKYRDVEVIENSQSDYFKDLRQSHLKKKIVTIEDVTTIEDEFEVIRKEERVKIIDPLNLEDFPNNFDKDLYAYYRKKLIGNDGLKMAGDKSVISVKPENVVNALLKKRLIRLFQAPTTKIVRVDKNVINEFDKRNPKPKENDSDKTPLMLEIERAYDNYYDNQKLLQIKEEFERPKDETPKHAYNKNNLFDVFLSGFFQVEPNKINKTSILWRLMEYRAKAKPLESISAFSVDWSKAFLKYIYENGVRDSTFYGVDHYDFSNKIFEGQKLYFDPDNFDSVLKWFMDAVRKLTALKKLPLIDLNLIKIGDFVPLILRRQKDGTPQDEKEIRKPEFDKLLRHEFENKELGLTRDRFVLMVMFGGLRINEFRPDVEKGKVGGELRIDDDGYGGKCVKWKTSHNPKLKEMANPVNDYADIILKKYDYQIPFYRNKLGNYGVMHEETFNKSLKLMAKEVGFLKRKVKDKERVNGHFVKIEKAIEDDITSLYARRHDILDIRLQGNAVITG